MNDQFVENESLETLERVVGKLGCPPFTHVSFILSREYRKNSAILWYQSMLVVCSLCGSKTSNSCHHQAYSISHFRLFNVFYNETMMI